MPRHGRRSRTTPRDDVNTGRPQRRSPPLRDTAPGACTMHSDHVSWRGTRPSRGSRTVARCQTSSTHDTKTRHADVGQRTAAPSRVSSAPAAPPQPPQSIEQVTRESSGGSRALQQPHCRSTGRTHNTTRCASQRRTSAACAVSPCATSHHVMQITCNRVKAPAAVEHATGRHATALQCTHPTP